MSQANEDKPLAHGVDELIAKLREDGVSAGVNEGNKIIAKAKAEAKQIVDKANNDARQRLDNAHKEAESLRKAGESAIKTAMRDMILEMKMSLIEVFSSDVNRLVSHQLQDTQLLKQMILEVVSKACNDIGRAENEKIEIILPETVVGLEQLKNHPEELQQSPLTDLVFGLTRDMLQKGVLFSTSEDVSSGIRVKFDDNKVMIDLTEESIAALILKHLQPRFRAILEGVVR